jgi:transcriptional antiterminator RfaH
MGYWAAQLQAHRTHLAIYFLERAGFTVYFPRILGQRRVCEPLFPTYAFIGVQLQWHAARYSPGVVKLIMNGQDSRSAELADSVVEGIKAREKDDGLIHLPKPRGLVRGDRLRVMRGPFEGQLALFEGMAARERVAVLLALMGGERRVLLPRKAVERYSKRPGRA